MLRYGKTQTDTCIIFAKIAGSHLESSLVISKMSEKTSVKANIERGREVPEALKLKFTLNIKK